mgnify:CR=1 FL=1
MPACPDITITGKCSRDVCSRNRLINEHKLALENINNTQRAARERALLVAGSLGLVALAVLIIGFVTAHGIARRFGGPIEALAKAADHIGQGNFDVTLPISQSAEMNQLTRRFGIMAQALREHQATNVDELLAGQQRLQAVLDSIDDGLLMIDRQGRLEHMNPVAQRQLGWEDDRLGVGLGTALQRPELDEQLRLVLRGGSLERAPEDLSIEVDGESRLLTYSLTPVSPAEGHILGAVMVLHDVTEQRAFERVRSEFVLRASHELRTPVTGMHMAFGLFRERAHFPENSREKDLLDTTDELGTGVIAFTPLAQGLLTDKYLNGIPEDARVNRPGGGSLQAAHLSEANIAHVRALNEIARNRGQSLAQLALAWTLRDPRVTSALIGASRPEQIIENVGALKNLSFSAEELAEIDRFAQEGGINLWEKPSSAE